VPDGKVFSLISSLPEPKPENFEKLLAFMRTLPYFLRAQLQAAAKDLPPSPGGRPRGLTPDQSREVCQQIGQLYGEGVDLASAKRRMALRYGVSLSTIQRAWKERGAWSHSSI
jgi:DNA invertase Pin-like site-specific DNA recombinase